MAADKALSANGASPTGPDTYQKSHCDVEALPTRLVLKDF